MTPSKLQIYQTTPSNTHSATERRPQMPDDTSKMILKPEDLHSISACEKAIYNLAENTNRDPLEIWQSTEAELSAQAAELKQSPGNSTLQVSITICAVIMIYTIYTREVKTAGLNQETILGMISIIPYILTPIAAFRITWIPRLLKFFSAELGFGFTLITTLLGTYSTTQKTLIPSYITWSAHTSTTSPLAPFYADYFGGYGHLAITNRNQEKTSLQSSAQHAPSSQKSHDRMRIQHQAL